MNSESILFVDDENHILEEYEGLFVDQELNILTSDDPLKALDLMSKQSVEVLVSDHKMPEMTGLDLITKVREESPDTIRIILTGYADKELVKDALNIGEVFRFLEKPCEPSKLVETVNDAVKYHQETSHVKKILEFNETYIDGKSTTDMFQTRLREKNSEIEMLVSENEYLSEVMENNSKVMFKTLVTMINLKSSELYDSSEWVSQFSAMIANKLDLSEDEKNIIYMASYLRDIGKLILPDSNLLKSVSMIKPSEIREFYRYPIIGEKILKMAGFEQIANVVGNLLERHDGSGPKGKSGKEIPIASQVLTVTDDTHDSLLLRSRKGSAQEMIYGMASMIKYIWSKNKIYYGKEVAMAAGEVLNEVIQGEHQDLLNIKAARGVMTN